MSILYIVGTPIGNLKDITLRALEILQQVDVVACEDTRRTLRMLNALGITKSLMSCRSHNERAGANRIIGKLRDGKEVAYVSDAGTPGISDPGSVLVGLVRSEGFPVVPIPGACAFTTLCSVSSFGGSSISLEGFLSPRRGRRKRRLLELLSRGDTFVLYESPFRILKLLEDLDELDSDRQLLLGREMTKLYEEYLEGTPGELLAILRERSMIKGEFSLLVGDPKRCYKYGGS